MTKSDVTQLTESSLDERGESFSDRALQPVDHGKEEQMSLHIHDMGRQTERALRRRRVSTAANLVLRKYLRWRRQSKRSNRNDTFDVRLRHTKSNPKKVKLFKKIFGSTMKRKLIRPKTSSGCALQRVAGLHNGPVQHSAQTEPPKSPAVKEKPDIFVSPVKTTSVKARIRSPRALSRSSKGHSVGHASREPMRPQSLSTALPPPPQRPVVLLRMLYPKDHQSSQQLRAADCHHKLITATAGGPGLGEPHLQTTLLYRTHLAQIWQCTENWLLKRLCLIEQEVHSRFKWPVAAPPGVWDELLCIALSKGWLGLHFISRGCLGWVQLGKFKN